MLSTLATMLAVYAGMLLLLRLFENGLIFFPQIPGRLTGDWNPHDLNKEDVWLQTSDGVKLHAWWISGAGAEFTFVAFHGNAANIANRADTYAFLRGLPVNVLAVEYRGYGKSGGSPSESGIYLDAQAAHDYLTGQRGIAPEQIVAYGQSLGTAVAADLAVHRKVGAVILEAPFPSARALARRVYFFLPGLTLVMKSRFDTSKNLQAAAVPVLVAHCRQDPVIPFAMGEAVFESAPEPKQFFPLNGYCHEEVSLVGPEAYARALKEFLGKLRVNRP